MVENYFEDVNVFLVSFNNGEKAFKRTIVAPYSWSEEKVEEYVKQSFQRVKVNRVTLVDSAWITKM